MKKLSLVLAALFFAAAAKSQAEPDWIAQIHFAGAEQISAGTNHLAFTNVFCSAEARALQSQTLDKLSRAPFAWFKSKMVSGAGDGAAQLRPLLDDLLKAEWYLAVRDTTNGSPEYALAIRLDNERARLWSENLAVVLQTWTGLGITPDKAGNWELKKHQPPDLVRFSRSGNWVVIDCGQDKLSSGTEILGRISSINSKKERSWLSADLNWPRLAQLFPALARFDFPKIQMEAFGRNLNLHLTGKLILSQPLPPLKEWRLPNNVIHQPFYSFTAVRGLAPWLQKQPWARPFLIQPPPEQIFIWALPQVPFQTFAAAPVPDADAALAQLDRKLSADTNWQAGLMMPLKMTMAEQKINFGGVPYISSFVQALHGPAGDFLYGGFFPNLPKCQGLPVDLIAHLKQPELVFYHWEITGPRLKGLPELTQLLLMVTRHEQLGGDSVANKWLNQIGPTLGQSVTEIEQTTPTELTFKRTATSGLTAVELVAFANWLEAKNFPGCDLKLPPPRIRPGKKPFKVLSTPAAAPAPPAPVKP